MPVASRSGGPARRADPAAAERRRIAAALDAAPDSVELTVEGHSIRVTHLDRVYWPAVPALAQDPVTKRDFLRYLLEVAPRMLPHARDRPLTLFRWPEGVGTRRVRQKHWEIPLPGFVERVDVFSDSKGRPDPYILCNNLATLVWLGHMGTLEFHVWHSRVRPGDDSPVRSVEFAASSEALQQSILSYPDYILFDVDPFIYSGREAPGKDPEPSAAGFARAREAALWLHALLTHLKLASFVKTSGKTGLHVVVPICRTLAYGAVREVARFVGEHLAAAHRDAITTEWSTVKRRGKVFIDYNMNVRAKSMPLPYSPRGIDGAPVSMPLTWARLRSAEPLDFRLPLLLHALPRGDPWSDVPTAKQSLEATLGRRAGGDAHR